MTTTIDVPVNTMIADLDSGLRDLLIAQLRRHGFDDVDVSFETPTSDWSATLTRPTVNLFLCDIRRSAKPGQSGPDGGRDNGRASERPPGMRVDCIFAITTWSKAVADEHRLLSQVLGVLYAFPILDGQLGPRFDDGSQRFSILASVGEQRPEQRADFWRSVGGVYKPALDYVVTLAVESGMVVERGPDVRTMTMRAGLTDAPRGGGVQELSHVGGIVRDEDGEPVADAWAAVLGLGRMATSNADGRFRIPRVPAGTYEVHVRAGDGREASTEMAVPGAMLDVVLKTKPGKGR
ncbi:MAG: Pvc16 family protein [Solirubrobacteraceae bacterium]|nr:Pvc16 family protein [Solirubrobacteraceae bacterium]